MKPRFRRAAMMNVSCGSGLFDGVGEGEMRTGAAGEEMEGARGWGTPLVPVRAGCGCGRGQVGAACRRHSFHLPTRLAGDACNVSPCWRLTGPRAFAQPCRYSLRRGAKVGVVEKGLEAAKEGVRVRCAAWRFVLLAPGEAIPPVTLQLSQVCTVPRDPLPFLHVGVNGIIVPVTQARR